MTTPNQCLFWDCDETLNRRDHFLCYDHYTGYQEGRIDECPQCGSYKRVNYPACRNCERQPAVAPPGGSTDAAFLDELRGLRLSLARRDGLREFMVFSNDTLEQLAAMRPTTERAMLEISGIGPAKMEKYGADVLRVIRASVSAPLGRESRRPATASATVERDNREFAADKDADRFFVYILLLNGPKEYYIGQTRELHERMYQHLNGMSKRTAGREPKLQWFTTMQTRKEAADLEVDLEKMKANPAGLREIQRWIVDFEHLVKRLDFKPHSEPVEDPAPERRMPPGGVSPPSSRRGLR